MELLRRLVLCRLVLPRLDERGLCRFEELALRPPDDAALRPLALRPLALRPLEELARVLRLLDPFALRLLLLRPPLLDPLAF